MRWPPTTVEITYRFRFFRINFVVGISCLREQTIRNFSLYIIRRLTLKTKNIRIKLSLLWKYIIFCQAIIGLKKAQKYFLTSCLENMCILLYFDRSIVFMEVFVKWWVYGQLFWGIISSTIPDFGHPSLFPPFIIPPPPILGLQWRDLEKLFIVPIKMTS